MSTELKKSMNLYYDERAEEYDEIYTSGSGPASISDPNVYKPDIIKVKEQIKKLKKIVLVDQSENRLKKAKEPIDSNLGQPYMTLNNISY